MYWVYAIQSKITKRIYVGHTKDLRKRLTDHNNGGTRSTSRERPWSLIACAKFPTRADARREEVQLKKSRGSRTAWLGRNAIPSAKQEQVRTWS